MQPAVDKSKRNVRVRTSAVIYIIAEMQAVDAQWRHGGLQKMDINEEDADLRLMKMASRATFAACAEAAEDMAQRLDRGSVTAPHALRTFALMLRAFANATD